jgi:hypothetical protein
VGRSIPTLKYQETVKKLLLVIYQEHYEAKTKFPWPSVTNGAFDFGNIYK